MSNVKAIKCKEKVALDSLMKKQVCYLLLVVKCLVAFKAHNKRIVRTYKLYYLLLRMTQFFKLIGWHMCHCSVSHNLHINSTEINDAKRRVQVALLCNSFDLRFRVPVQKI